MLLHPELGLGVRLRTPGTGARYSTAPREAIALEAARSAGAEELRVLYVAMTRAQEKLILITSQRDMEPALGRAAMELTPEPPSPFTVRKAKNAGDWLLACALRHPSGGALRRAAGVVQPPADTPDSAPWAISLHSCAPEEWEPPPEEAPAQPDMALFEELRVQADFVYPFEDCLEIRAKVSASKLSAEQSGSRELNLSKPAWLGAQGMTPAERGIALHEFMQFADFARAAEDPAGEIARLAERAYLTPEQAGAIELDRVQAFFRSGLGRRVLASEEVVKERRFTAAIPAEMAQPGTEARGEPVVLQGAVDCTFLEGGRIHIIDFKTDRVETVEELWQRYQVQIRLYAYAMEQAAGQQVGDLVLYSTYLSQACVKPYSRDAS